MSVIPSFYPLNWHIYLGYWCTAPVGIIVVWHLIHHKFLRIFDVLHYPKLYFSWIHIEQLFLNTKCWWAPRVNPLFVLIHHDFSTHRLQIWWALKKSNGSSSCSLWNCNYVVSLTLKNHIDGHRIPSSIQTKTMVVFQFTFFVVESPNSTNIYPYISCYPYYIPSKIPAKSHVCKLKQIVGYSIFH